MQAAVHAVATTPCQAAACPFHLRFAVDPAAVHADVRRQLLLPGSQLAAKTRGRRAIVQALDIDILIGALDVNKGDGRRRPLNG